MVPSGAESRSISITNWGLSGVALRGRVIVQRESLLPARDAAPPLRADRAGSRGCEGPHQFGDDPPAVADDRHVRPADLAQLGRIDVDVDDLGVRGEIGDPAGHPVVEAGAQGDQQVRLLHGGDGGVVAVHARHAEAERMVVGERTACHQRGHDRHVDLLGQLAAAPSAARDLRIPPPA